MATSELDAAREQLVQLFQEPQFKGPPFLDTSESAGAEEDATTLAELSQTILNLLERFPSLASEKFRHGALVKGRIITCDHGCFPLSFFVWNNLDILLLEKVHQLYPEAICMPQLQRASLLEMECDWLFASDATLRWLISKTDVFDETVIFRLLMFRDRLSLDMVHSMISKTSNSGENETYNQLVNLLIARGYSAEVIGWVLDHCGFDSLTLHTVDIAWQMDSRRVDLIVNILPKVHELTLGNLNWTSEAWKSVLGALPRCKLRAVRLQLEIDWLLATPEILKTFQAFLASYTGSLPVIKLMGYRCRENPDRVFQSMLGGLRSNPRRRSGPMIDRLELACLKVSSKVIAELEEFMGCLCLWGVGITTDESNKAGHEGGSCSGTIKERSSARVWNAIAILQPSIDSYTIERQYEFHGGNTISALTIKFTSKWTGSKPRADITDMLITILGYPRLKEVVLTLPKHSFDAKKVCQSLRDNESLRRLSLVGMNFGYEDKAVPACILQTLQEKNTTLQDLTIFDHKRAVTLSEAPHQRIVDVSCAEHIGFMLHLNRFGRQYFRHETTSLERMILLLRQSSGHFVCTLEGLQFEEEDDDLAAYEPIVQFNHSYEKLRKSVKGWCESRRMGAEKQSILYGLLRESPGLWCHS